MKAKIGNYPGRLRATFYENYMNKKYGYVDWPKEETKYEKFLEWLEDRVQDFYNIFNRLWFDRRKQKVSVHIDPWDTWSVYQTIGYIALPMLKKLKETKHGSPYVDLEDVPEELRGNGTIRNESMQYDLLADEKYDNLAWNMTHQRWEWVLNEMIFAFESIVGNNEDWESKYHTGEMDRIHTPVDEDGNEVAEEDAKYFRWDKGANDTSHFDSEGYKKEGGRIANGFRLFGKYYQGLWS